MRVTAILVTIAIAVVASILGYQAGLAQGLAATGTAAAPIAHGPWAFGFGLFGLLIPLLFLFLFFGLARAAFWGGHWGGGPGHHAWDRTPPMFEEWHRRAHGERGSGTPPTSGQASV
jgi:hypothetical protein